MTMTIQSTGEEHWARNGPDRETAARFLNKMVNEATTGHDLANVAEAVAAFGSRVGSFEDLLRPKIIGRIKVLDSIDASDVDTAEVAALGRAWRLLDRPY